MVDGYAYQNGKQRVHTVYGNEYSANTISYFKRTTYEISQWYIITRFLHNNKIKQNY